MTHGPTLRPGALLFLGDTEDEIVILDECTRLGIPPYVSDQLYDLLRGADVVLDTATEARLRELGLLTDTHAPLDPIFRETLAARNRAEDTGTPHGMDPQLAEAMTSQLLDCHAGRKVFHAGVGQAPILPAAALRRAALIGFEPSRVLCVGDDDFMSRVGDAGP